MVKQYYTSRLAISLLLIHAFSSLVSYGQFKKKEEKSQSVNTAPTFSKGEKVSGGNFSGDAWVKSLASVNVGTTTTSISNVTFAPTSRTKWHLHPSGQILLITDGVGYYQEKGQSVRLMRKGDVICCPPNVAHWHGASPTNSVTHLAVGFEDGNGRVKWLEPVTDEEYNKLD